MLYAWQEARIGNDHKGSIGFDAMCGYTRLRHFDNPHKMVGGFGPRKERRARNAMHAHIERAARHMKDLTRQAADIKHNMRFTHGRAAAAELAETPTSLMLAERAAKVPQVVEAVRQATEAVRKLNESTQQAAEEVRTFGEAATAHVEVAPDESVLPVRGDGTGPHTEVMKASFELREDGTIQRVLDALSPIGRIAVTVRSKHWTPEEFNAEGGVEITAYCKYKGKTVSGFCVYLDLVGDVEFWPTGSNASLMKPMTEVI